MHTRLVAKQRVSGTVEDEWDRLLERSLSIVCIAGFDGRLKRVNTAVSANFGYTPGELVHPDDWPDTEALIQGLARGRSVHGAEVRARDKDGNYRWILWDGVPCVDDEVFLATGQDITSRKVVEEELRESQERFQLIAGATGEAVWDWDLRNDRVWCNEVYHRMFGIPDDEVDSRFKWWQRQIHPDDLERVLAAIPPPIVNGSQQWLLEYRMRRRDGTYAHVYNRGFVIVDGSGNPVRIVGSVMDVSKLKQAQEELRESEQRSRMVDRADPSGRSRPRVFSDCLAASASIGATHDRVSVAPR
jgi:PAS domain S-box-containing protein